MVTHPDNTRDASQEAPPAVAVKGLSFRYRALNEESPPSKKTRRAVPDSSGAGVAEESPYAIRDISFSLAHGELLLIAGPSGCGKSTLLKCLNGLIPHTFRGELEGEIWIEGRAAAGMSLRERARYIGTMLQDPEKQIVGSTVEQEVAFGLENLALPRAEIRHRVDEVLRRLQLETYRQESTFALSGGQRQQVAAAGVLVMQPSIFLFDEPFANLDARAIDELEELIKGLRAEGRTVIIVEHRVEETLKLRPDKVLLMQDGRQVFLGDVSSFLEVADPEQVKLPIEATLRRLTEAERRQVVERLVRPIVTRRAVEATGSSTDEPVLVFQDVHYRYEAGGREILRGISFEIRRGETVALLGPNGAGKTTLVKQALGLLRPTAGAVLLYGEDTRKLSVAQLATRIGYVFQSPSAMLFAPTVQKELSFGPENLRFPPERLRRSVQRAAEALDVARFADRSPFSLSFGQQKRVSIASVLAMESHILLLDEPTAGQDYRSYISFMEHLRNLPELDALLFITHDLDLALRYTQRVLLLKDGCLVADGAPLEVLADQSLLESCNLRPTSLLRYLLAECSRSLA
ncbi:ABC transporter ATP-binding protein [Thermogemmatispora sp.]|uniref:ABC transporter ATP-binding protein n=1 Tax=Thermogemmatispora sp. TaxID=1968838 RepID=UPI001D317156|nr:ABC transporter ATP-binding protein [Thermogemmatispora sp.]MBX5451312.1 ABC transporter ATP-binding protein [Thermogemmatispora sp.]